MFSFNRRFFLTSMPSLLASCGLLAEEARPKSSIGLGFGTYGMKSLSTFDALRVCDEIGYDGIEFALINGWLTEPSLLSKNDRIQIRQQLSERNLAVPSLLESLPCLRSDAEHRDNLQRLKRATELAHDLSPSKPPIVQSIVGGTTSQWEQTKTRLVDQLSEWAEIGRSSETVICFKPHAAHAVHTPERAVWVHGQINSPWLKLVYDYSHFYLEGLSIAESLNTLLPITAYVQIKDSRGTREKHEYLLPGDGTTDYAQMLTLLTDANFSGFVNIEVSSHVHRKADYDPIATAKLCYQRIAPIFKVAGVDRPKQSE